MVPAAPRQLLEAANAPSQKNKGSPWHPPLYCSVRADTDPLPAQSLWQRAHTALGVIGMVPMGKRCEKRHRYHLLWALEQVCDHSPCPSFSPCPSQPVGEFHLFLCLFACVPPPLSESPAPVLVIKQGLFPQGVLNLEQFWEVSGFSMHNLQQSLGAFFMLLFFVLRETFGEVLIAWGLPQFFAFVQAKEYWWGGAEILTAPSGLKIFHRKLLSSGRWKQIPFILHKCTQREERKSLFRCANIIPLDSGSVLVELALS